jgi:diguanylate cyclase (GGDEF)-like protein
MNSNSGSLNVSCGCSTNANGVPGGLTRLVDEHAVLGQVEQAIARAKEQGTSLSLLLLDLCALKMANDSSGQQSDDQVVLEVARLLQDDVREEDVLGRITPTELLVVLKGCCRSDATFVGRRLQNKVEGLRLEAHPSQYTSTGLSFGVAELGVNGEEMDDLLRVATMDAQWNATTENCGETEWISAEILGVVKPQ